jgi:hypothetical protein
MNSNKFIAAASPLPRDRDVVARYSSNFKIAEPVC